MGFPVSTVGVSSGEDWETNLNAALAVIDAHDHSPGNGVQISPSGLNISSDLSFVGNNVFDLKSVIFEVQGSPLGNAGLYVGCLYVSGNELYYNDVSGGNQVQITLSGAVNATSSGISSGSATAAFSGGVLLVKSSSISYANIAVQSVLLSNSGNLSNQLTLKAPTLSGSYAVALPAIPGSTSFLTIDTSGNMASTVSTSLGIVGSNIANATIGNTKFISGTQIPLSDTAKTSGYTALVTDSLINCDSSGGAFQITLYSATSSPGLELDIYKTSSDFSAVTITDSGSFTTTINTQGECVRLRSTSSGWAILNRAIPSAWASMANVISGFSVSPTIGSPTTNTFRYRRVGTDLEIRINYTDGISSGSSNGTGSYLLGLPSGLSINTSVMTVISVDSESSGYLGADALGAGSINGSTTGSAAVLYASSSSHLKIWCAAPNTGIWSSGLFGINNTSVIVQGFVPISGWNG